MRLIMDGIGSAWPLTADTMLHGEQVPAARHHHGVAAGAANLESAWAASRRELAVRAGASHDNKGFHCLRRRR